MRTTADKATIPSNLDTAPNPTTNPSTDTTTETATIERVGSPRAVERLRAKSNPEHRTNALVERLRALCYASPLDDLAIVEVLSTMPVEGSGGVAVLWQYARQALAPADFDRIHFCAWCSLLAYDPLIRAFRWWRATHNKENPARMEVVPYIALRHLNNTDLRAVRFRGFKMFDAWMAGAILARANLAGADLYGARLHGANLAGADLSNADLYECQLCNANLTGANLYGADLTRANLTRANLTRANFTGAGLAHVKIRGAILTGVIGLDDGV